MECWIKALVRTASVGAAKRVEETRRLLSVHVLEDVKLHQHYGSRQTILKWIDTSGIFPRILSQHQKADGGFET